MTISSGRGDSTSAPVPGPSARFADAAAIYTTIKIPPMLTTTTLADYAAGGGSFHWCAPEAILGLPCSVQSDIFSMGEQQEGRGLGDVGIVQSLIQTGIIIGIANSRVNAVSPLRQH